MVYLYGTICQYIEYGNLEERKLVGMFDSFENAKEYVDANFIPSNSPILSITNNFSQYTGLLQGYDDYDIVTEKIPRNPKFVKGENSG